MSNVSDAWGADVPISVPEAPEDEVKVDFLGFGFTMGGMVFNLTEAEIEEIFTPPFMPEGYRGDSDREPLPYSHDEQEEM